MQVRSSQASGSGKPKIDAHVRISQLSTWLRKSIQSTSKITHHKYTQKQVLISIWSVRSLFLRATLFSQILRCSTFTADHKVCEILKSGQHLLSVQRCSADVILQVTRNFVRQFAVQVSVTSQCNAILRRDRQQTHPARSCQQCLCRGNIFVCPCESGVAVSSVCRTCWTQMEERMPSWMFWSLHISSQKFLHKALNPIRCALFRCSLEDLQKRVIRRERQVISYTHSRKSKVAKYRRRLNIFLCKML